MRIIDEFSKYRLTKSGLRYHDCLIVNPGQGHRFELDLHRTQYIFTCRKNDECPRDGLNIYFKEFCEKDFRFSLELCSMVSQINESSRYLLKSLDGIPFRLNHQIVFEAYLEHDDQVMLGHNLIYCRSKNFKEKKSDLVLSEKVVTSNLPILIEGETGTGKTHFAKKIHTEANFIGDFVHVNLASFSPNLIESELFGHEKGAFTGAILAKAGAIEEAQHGTLFLDEIDSLSLELQVKLLLFLDNKMYRRVGGRGQKQSNARLVFASGRDLERMVKEGKFRRDLYFRLRAGEFLKLPALRENKESIVEFCQDFSMRNECSLSSDLLEFYKKCFWPGNFRQLNTHLERKLVRSKTKKLIYEEIDSSLQTESSFMIHQEDWQGNFPLEEFKKHHMRKVLSLCDESVTRAAKMLKVAPQTVRSLA